MTRSPTSEEMNNDHHNLGAARRLIDHPEERAPGNKASLEFSGAGNDPRLIRLAIKEARRRGL